MMVVKIEDHEYNGYVTKQLNLREAEPNDTIEFSLLFDKPMTGESKFGTWYKFTAELFEPEKHARVSFFSPRRAADGRVLGEVLSNYPTGTRIRLKANLRKSQKGSFYLVWDVEEVGGVVSGKQNTTPPVKTLNPSTLDDYHQQVVLAMVKESGGENKGEEWVRENLKTIGVKDEFIIQKILDEYNEKFEQGVSESV